MECMYEVADKLKKAERLVKKLKFELGEESLEVGKWYSLGVGCNSPVLFCYTGDSNHYGFNVKREWADEIIVEDTEHYKCEEMEDTQVLFRLRLELQFRYKMNSRIHNIDNDCTAVVEKRRDFHWDGYTLCFDIGGQYWNVFEGGIWADVAKTERPDVERRVIAYAESADWDLDKVKNYINSVLTVVEYRMLEGIDGSITSKAYEFVKKFKPRDKFDNIRQAFELGKEIEYRSSWGGWFSETNPSWKAENEYRVREIQIGDWVILKGSGVIKIKTQQSADFHNLSKRVKDFELIDKLDNLMK